MQIQTHIHTQLKTIYTYIHPEHIHKQMIKCIMLNVNGIEIFSQFTLGRHKILTIKGQWTVGRSSEG